MVHLVENQNDNSPGKDSLPATGNAIPPRSHSRQAGRGSPSAQPTLKSHTIRLVVATAIGMALMFALLMLAVKYAQRDWSQKNQRAWASHAPGLATTPVDAAVDGAVPQGWTYELSPAATQRQLDRLASDRLVPDGWLILARGLSSRLDPQIVISSLRMAMAIHGENAEIMNELGAVYLQQKRMKEARDQLLAAEQIRPGFASTRFNLALCAISDRDPEKAVWLLGQYLGRRPDDTAALRLQSTLLSQLGRSRDALRMLERFLKNQPVDQPLFLEAAMLAARLGQNGNAIRYLETAMNGNSIRPVVQAYQSPAFREIRLSGEGDKLSARIADKARTAFGTPVPEDEIQPLRNPSPETKVR